MDCEICGEPVRGFPVKIRVEGTVMSVCRRCADLGERVQDRPRSTSFVRDGKRGPRAPAAEPPLHASWPPAPARPPQQRRQGPREDELEIIDNFSDIIKGARGAMSHEEFAASLKEKSTVIQKIEAGKMKPTIKLARAIEKQYHVVLVGRQEGTEDVEGSSWKDEKKDSSPSLGDFIKNKQ